MSSEFKIIFQNGIIIEECQKTVLFSFGELLIEGIREVMYFTVFNGLPDLNSLKIQIYGLLLLLCRSIHKHNSG